MIPRRSLVVGNPAHIIRKVSDEMIALKTEGTGLYQALPGEMSTIWSVCNPIFAPKPGNANSQVVDYEPWSHRKTGQV